MNSNRDNVVRDTILGEESEESLVQRAADGNRTALEKILAQYQNWIYNIALRMVGSSQDAEDITQEILIKVITKLSTFQGKSSFKTWLYRIVTNHVLTMNRRGMEYVFTSFELYREILHSAPESDFQGEEFDENERLDLVEETKTKCMIGMLVCLSREQRLVFILALFGVDSSLGAEILEISRDNFRQKLSRARKDLANYMDKKCGLLHKENSCRCSRKTRAAIDAGYVDPKQRIFHADHLQRVEDVVKRNSSSADTAMEIRTQKMFQKQPFNDSPNYMERFQKVLAGKEFHELISF